MTERGIITQIEGDWMEVKVPTGVGCGHCSEGSGCTFRGPDSAYRTFRVRREAGYSAGDQVRLDEPGSSLAMTVLVLLLLPIVLIIAGYLLLECCVRLPYATVVFWVFGVALWGLALYGANCWMSRAARFQPKLRPVSPRMD